MSSRGYDAVKDLIEPLARGYTKMCEQTATDRRYTEFYGLRDFYSTIKMVVSFPARNPTETQGFIFYNQLEHSIRRNFGGFEYTDTERHKDPMVVFDEFLLVHKDQLSQGVPGNPPTDPIEIIRSSLTGEHTTERGMESRYLLILTENMAALPLILSMLPDKQVVFGSYFPQDDKDHQVWRNISRIKACMERGTPVVLLNLDDLYESLYDTLNHSYKYLGDKRFTDIGLGTKRVKGAVHEKFRLVIVAQKDKVYAEFPPPLINRLEKHVISVTTLLSGKQELINRLEQWVIEFITPALCYRPCPSTCGKCGSQMKEPYKLPCGHSVGLCCRQNSSNECPQCGDSLDDGYVWHIDDPGLKNRSYFEGISTPADAFIGYSKDVLALTIKKADYGENTDDEIMERAGTILLECATAEAVLRLGKSQLSRKSTMYRDRYLEKNLDSLLAFMTTSLLNDKPKLVQVTTFVSALGAGDEEKLVLKLKEVPLVTKILALHDYSTEEHFTDDIKEYFTDFDKDSEQDKVLLLQCQFSGNQTNSMDQLDCVRYIIQRERDNAWRQRAGNDSTRKTSTRHVILLLPIVRGRHFKGYQGGEWQCVHIDEIRVESVLPGLKNCLHKKPSNILADCEPLCSFLKEDGNSIDQFDGKQFLLDCIPAAAYRIGSLGGYLTDLLQQMLRSDDDIPWREKFLIHLMNHMYLLMAEKENAYQSYNWVTEHAAKGSNMKHSLTIGRALAGSLEQAWSCALAAVVSFCSRNQNMQLLLDADVSGSVPDLWLGLFKLASSFKLTVKDISMRNDSSSGMSRLPESYKPLNMAKGTISFIMRFPFCWIVADVINNIINAEGPGSLDVDQLEARFNNSGTVGQLVKKFGMGLMDAYIHDFVHMMHPCMSEEEHSIMKSCLEFHCGTDYSLVRVHMVYLKFKSTFDRLSVLLQIDSNPAILSKIKSKFEENKSLPCDLIAFYCYLEDLMRTGLKVILEDSRAWVGKLRACQISGVMSKTILDDEAETLKSQCRSLELKLIVKKLYLENLVIPHKIGKQERGGYKYNALRTLLERTDSKYKDLKSFEDITGLLKSELRVAIIKVYGEKCPPECPGCNEDMDSPVPLPCGSSTEPHFLCFKCFSDDDMMCPYSKCGKLIPEEYVAGYKPEENRDTSSVQHNQLMHYRKSCNQFVMRYVADVVFADGDDEAPEQEIIDKLMGYVTKGDKMKEFNLYNCDDVVDPTPVVRTFILKLLIQCTGNYVYADDYLSKLLENQSSPQRQEQIMALFLDCYQDKEPDRKHEKIKDLFDRYNRDIFKQTTLSKLTVKTVEGIAQHHSIFRAVIHQVLEDHTSSQHLGFLKGFMFDVYSDERRCLVMDQIFFTGGVNDLQRIADSEFNFLLTKQMRNLLRECKEPDLFAVGAGEQYTNTKNSFLHILNDEGTAISESLTILESDFSTLLKVCVQATMAECFASDQIIDTLLKCEAISGIPSHYAMLSAVLRHDLPQMLITPFLELAIHAYTALAGRSGRVIEAEDFNATTKFMSSQFRPLAIIIDSPDEAKELYMPTMPEDEVDETIMEINIAEENRDTVWECKNGHPYVIGDCGRPWRIEKCSKCDAMIGGTLHAPAPGNRPRRSTPTGHTIGDNTRIESRRLRTMKPLPCAILRCLVHLTMFASSIVDVKKLLTLITVSAPDESDCQQFIASHIESDMRQISQILGRSRDECLRLIHMVLNKMADEPEPEPMPLLDHINSRKNWEKFFCGRYINPFLYERTEPALKEFESQLCNLNADGSTSITLIKDLLHPQQADELNQNDVLKSALFWKYRHPVSVENFQTELENETKEKEHTLLKLLLSKRSVLRDVESLPTILGLVEMINQQFHGQISRTEARKETLEKFIMDNARIEGLRDMINKVINVWNRNVEAIGSEQVKRLSLQSNLDTILPGNRRTCMQMLVKYLVAEHNGIVSEEREAVTVMNTGLDHNRKLKLAEVTESGLITIESDERLLRIILARCDYELKDTAVKSFNWHAIEDDFRAKYVNLKLKIEETCVPAFQFPDDFSTNGLFKKLQEHAKQKALPETYRETIAQQYGGIIAKLNDSLSLLRRIIKNVAAISTIYDPEQNLEEYTQSSRLPSTYFAGIQAMEHCCLKHLVSLWNLLSFEKSKSLLSSRQEPFDDLQPDCIEQLSAEQQRQLEELFTAQSKETKTLLRYLYEYISLSLTRTVEERDGFSSMKLECSLYEGEKSYEGLYRYLLLNYSDEVVKDVVEKLKPLPCDIKITYAPAVWRFICARHLGIE